MVATLALLAGHCAAARRLEFTGTVTLHFAVGINATGASRCLPRTQGPRGSREGLELQTLLLPTTTGFA